MKIKIKVNHHALEGIVHGSVWRQPPFLWEPVSFAVESFKLETRLIDESVQFESLEAFKTNPNDPLIYMVAGNPDDSKAKYFAAFLCAIHKEFARHRENIIWENITGGWDNPLLKKEIEPSMLVISGLAENSTPVKLEKARDLVEKFPNVPRIVVCAGEDPLSFAQVKLHIPCHGLAYFPSKITKTVQEVM